MSLDMEQKGLLILNILTRLENNPRKRDLSDNAKAQLIDMISGILQDRIYKTTNTAKIIQIIKRDTLLWEMIKPYCQDYRTDCKCGHDRREHPKSSPTCMAKVHKYIADPQPNHPRHKAWKESVCKCKAFRIREL